MDKVELSDILQLMIGVFALVAIIVNVLVFAAQRKSDQKREAVRVGLDIEHLVVRWAYIDMVIFNINNKVYSILSNSDVKKMESFESEEIYQVYSEIEIKDIEKIFKKNYYNPMLSSSPSIVFDVSSNVLEKANNLYPMVLKEVFSGEKITDSVMGFHRILLDTLNRMETLCVMMDKGIADEDTVYDISGNQLIQFVKVLYYYISFLNDTDTIKKYGNNKKIMKHVIKVFVRWSSREKEL